MTAYRAIAGSDIRVGMTVSLTPGMKPFKVTRVAPSEVDGLADRLWFIYDGDTLPDKGATFVNRWYAEVVGS